MFRTNFKNQTYKTHVVITIIKLLFFKQHLNICRPKLDIASVVYLKQSELKRKYFINREIQCWLLAFVLLLLTYTPPFKTNKKFPEAQ